MLLIAVPSQRQDTTSNLYHGVVARRVWGIIGGTVASSTSQFNSQCCKFRLGAAGAMTVPALMVSAL